MDSAKKRKSTNYDSSPLKRLKSSSDSDDVKCKAGKVKKVLMRNFMCHDSLEVELNPNVNFIVGHNGSGKSAILTALTVGLGAKANVTSRGKALKDFIKKGKQSAAIEIFLYNKGPMAYKPELYGDVICVNRTIGATSGYKLKNSEGKVVSTKRRDLDLIVRSLNIQIDNPIAVLNQDVSRTFLVSAKPEEKYDLFMKATLLDVIGNNYRDADMTCHEEYEKLKKYNEFLSETRKDVEQLKSNVKKVEEIDETRKQVKLLEAEMNWAMVIKEEEKLQALKEQCTKCENNLKEIESFSSSVDSKHKDIDENIEKLKKKIREAEEEVAGNVEAYNNAKKQYIQVKEEYAVKSREWRSVQSKIKRLEDDKGMLLKEIHRLEGGDGEEENGKNELIQQLRDVQQKLDEVEAMLRTKQTDQMHFQSDKLRLVKEKQNAKIEIDNCKNRIDRLKRELTTLKTSSSSALAVYGRNIPRLLRRIDEEFANGKFQKKPRGPLGADIKMKDPAWAPAVESFLGPNILCAFCVDNNHDAKVLNGIIKEIFLNERPPQTISSKFYENIHDVRRHCARSDKYSNLLDAMDISDPVIANCLIDQREIECLLLIPTSKEASEIMSDARNVPRNCKRAITQQADTFFPDPNYRSYGGPRNLRAKFLQVSTGNAIHALEEEIAAAVNARQAAVQTYTELCEKEKRTTSELDHVYTQVTSLRNSQHQYKTRLNELRDNIEAKEGLNIQLYKNELVEFEKKLAEQKDTETRTGEVVLELQQKIETFKLKVDQYRELRQNLDAKVSPLKDEIKQLQDEKGRIRDKGQHTLKKIRVHKQALQDATAKLEVQERATAMLLSKAEKHGERIDTTRSARELEELINEMKRTIAEIEKQFGTINQLREELKKKESKYGKSLLLAARIEKNYQAQQKRLEARRESYEIMKQTYGEKIQKSFSDVLALRKKKGIITVNHQQKLIDLEVSDRNEKKRPTNDTRTLSGGERSYSTVAFILALWDCTGLPFFFLDEFDVFMDKVNRRVIMDILLDHTRSHPQSQFTFLTPLDTSSVIVDDYISIHRLNPPKRTHSDETS